MCKREPTFKVTAIIAIATMAWVFVEFLAGVGIGLIIARMIFGEWF
jgi:hypothetical protein